MKMQKQTEDGLKISNFHPIDVADAIKDGWEKVTSSDSSKGSEDKPKKSEPAKTSTGASIAGGASGPKTGEPKKADTDEKKA